MRGEPEHTVAELVDALSNGKPLDTIKGISYLDSNNKIVNNAPRQLIRDLDSLPFAARDLLGDAVYHNPKLKCGPYTTLITSRNCPYRCIYCVPSSLTFAREIEYKNEHGRKPLIGFRSVENVAEEIAMLDAQGYKAIGFMDDNFIWNEERTLALCEIMRRHGIVWGCQARADAITPAIAKALGESNCRYVDLGVESFNDDILKYIHKGETADDIRNAVKLLREHKVPVKLNVLIGSSPLETKETVKETLRETKKLKADQVMFNIVSPFPGLNTTSSARKTDGLLPMTMSLPTCNASQYSISRHSPPKRWSDCCSATTSAFSSPLASFSSNSGNSARCRSCAMRSRQ